MREALARSRRATGRHSGSRISGRPWSSGTVGLSRRSAPAIVWQDRRTAEPVPRASRVRRRDDAPQAHRPRRRSLLLRDQARVAAARRRGAPPRRTGELAAGTVESWLVARLTSGRVHVTDHTNASRTLLYNLATRDLGRRAARHCSASRASSWPTSCRRPASWARRRREHLGIALPIAGLAGDQQSALFGQGCCAEGLAKNTYGTGAFLLVYTGQRLSRA